MNIKIVKNKYLNSLFIMMLLSASAHMLILFFLALRRGDLYILNYFNILDLDILFHAVFKNDFLGNFASLIFVVLFYFLILYAPLGAGHGMAAKAIAEAFAQNYSEFEVKTANVLDFAFEIFRAGLPGIFNYMTLKIPFLYKWTYDYLNHESRYNFLNRVSDAFIKKSRFVKFIKEFNPDFILSTNPLPMHLVSLTKHKKIIDILSANVCTDFGFHSFWYNSDVNYYFTANEDIKEALTKYGVSQDKIIVTGIPISLKFNKETDRKKIIDSLNFDENTPILLIVGGKIKYSVLRNIIENVEKKSALRFIVVAGRDKKLQKELENSSLKKNPKVKIFNFVDNIHDYMSVADLILTKAGGLTVAE